jgi:hypothetical protein
MCIVLISYTSPLPWRNCINEHHLWNSKADKIIKQKYIIKFVADAWATFKVWSTPMRMHCHHYQASTLSNANALSALSNAKATTMTYLSQRMRVHIRVLTLLKDREPVPGMVYGLYTECDTLPSLFLLCTLDRSFFVFTHFPP